jgi:hypothetical protein
MNPGNTRCLLTEVTPVPLPAEDRESFILHNQERSASIAPLILY